MLQRLYLQVGSYRLPSLDKEGQGWLDPVQQSMTCNHETYTYQLVAAAITLWG
ncbi:hypothetical protein [Pontibacter virosus]|uniref:hypothetical protein n=1 Tax=Pontibacter virosus TaxID=1765052 RepID=UPI0014032721|nr:hypothetical protein [Pontibacter virosus]